MAKVEANRALMEGFLAQLLGFSVLDLQQREKALSLPLQSEVRFKRYLGQIDAKVWAGAFLARQAAERVVRSLDIEEPYTAHPLTAAEVRSAILRTDPYVNLDSLLRFCWDRGVVVFRMVSFPNSAKRFDGMALYVRERPMIALGSKRDAAPWLAFHLAHELGHHILGHVKPGTPPVIDGSLEGGDHRSEQEIEADRFACEVLTGEADPRFNPHPLRADGLARYAQQEGYRRGIAPGVFALIYGRSNDRWGVAQKALRRLGLESGGTRKIAQALDAHLDRERLTEADARLLRVLDEAA